MRWGTLFLAVFAIGAFACGGKIIDEDKAGSRWSPVDVCAPAKTACDFVSGSDVSSVMAQNFTAGTAVRLPANPVGSIACTFGDDSSRPQAKVSFACPQPDPASVKAQFQERIAAGFSIDESFGLGLGASAIWSPPVNGYGELRVVSGLGNSFAITVAAPSNEPDPEASARVLAEEVIGNI